MKVYKYRGVEKDIFDRDFDTLKNNMFFAPKFEMLNDPFEANFNEILSKVSKSLNTIFKVDVSSMEATFERILSFKDRLGVYSISKTYHSEQMWAYYASSNYGYCIEYDLEKLEDKTKNADFSARIDVRYSDDIPVIGLKDILNSSNKCNG